MLTRLRTKTKIEQPVPVVEERIEKTILPETVASVHDDRDGGADTLKEGIAETEIRNDGSNGVVM